MPSALALGLAAHLGRGAGRQRGAALGDYIVAVVNQELVTAGEVQQRLAQRARPGARAAAPACRPRPSCASRCSRR